MAVTAVPPRPKSVLVTSGGDKAQYLDIVHESAGASNPIQRTTIDRKSERWVTNILDLSDDGWRRVATLTGAAKKWTDKSTRARDGYQYRVRTENSKGHSAGRGSNTVYTTPANPTIRITRINSTSVLIERAMPTVPETLATRFDIRDGSTDIATYVTLPYTHTTSPDTVSHSYRVAAQIRFSEGSTTAYVWAPWSSPVVLPASAAPGKPTDLSPNGGMVSVAAAVVFNWVHNPIDATAQTAYELQYRMVGAGSWTTVSGTTASTRSITLAKGDYEWQVRTKGLINSWSPWSDLMKFTVVDRPTVTITAPGPTYDATSLTVAWLYAQSQSLPQTDWTVQLLQGADVLEEISDDGTATSAVLATKLVSGTSYTVTVTVGTNGVSSATATANVAVTILQPAVPSITGAWNEAIGGVELVAAAGSGGAIGTARLVVERSVDAGVSWEPVVDAAPNITMTDFASLSFGTTRYRVTAVSAKGGENTATADVVADSESIWLKGGENFSLAARLPVNPEIDVENARLRSLRQHDGQELPVVYSGKPRSRVVSVSGETDAEMTSEVSAQMEDLERIAQAIEPLCLHSDPDGRRVIGSLSAIRQPRRNAPARWGFSYTVTEATQ